MTQLGPVVETALDNIVADQTAPAASRILACRYLADPGIGTAKSLPILQTAATGPDPGGLEERGGRDACHYQETLLRRRVAPSKS